MYFESDSVLLLCAALVILVTHRVGLSYVATGIAGKMLLLNAKRHLHGSIIIKQECGRLNLIMHAMETKNDCEGSIYEKEQSVEPAKKKRRYR